jgi:signal transduction histidine kinase
MTGLLVNLELLLFCTYLVNALLAMLLAGSGLSFRGAWLWVLAQGLMAIGTLCDALPAGFPEWASTIVGNSAYVTACICYSHSVWVFRSRHRFPRLVYVLALIQVGSFILAYNQAYIVRAILFSSWMSVGSLITAGLLLWKVERRFWIANGLTALPFLVLGISSLTRILVLRTLSSQTEVLHASEQNVWFIAGAILLSTVMLFGYFMMSWIQTMYILSRKDQEILARNIKLVEAARTKDLFYAIIAHDIRGPIGGAARYVRKHLPDYCSDPDKQAKDMETLASTLEKTSDYLEKLLWWSRTQMEDWSPQKTVFSLEGCIDQAISLLQPRLQMKHVAITVQVPPYPQVRANQESIQLILNNLLSNAVKYSPPGRSVHISWELLSGFCQLTIQDHGTGMSPETIARLFHIEDKLSSIGTADELGSGLGLILAQSLAGRNGCRIELDSQLGEGTAARLWVPLAESG